MKPLREEVIERFGDLIKEMPEAEDAIVEYETTRRARDANLSRAAHTERDVWTTF